MSGIIDIAKLANVSKSTVSRVLSNNGYVKPETRAAIEKVMDDLHYRPNMFAKGMRTKRSFSIGILFPDLSNPFFAEWYAVVDKISREAGYLNYICITDPLGATEEQRIDDLLARHIDGILFFSYCKRPEILKKLKAIASHTPVVCCDGMMIGEDLSYVCADGKEGTYQATRYLIEKGRKRIAYIKGNDEYQVGTNRFEGYHKALVEAGLPSEEQLIFRGNFKLEDGYAAAKYFMGQAEPPDAIMAATDYMALGVLNFLNEKKVSIPREVAVIGFDNLNIATTVKPRLSTIELPIGALASSAIETLIACIENYKEPVRKVFPCKLILRQTT
jgi:DNA-binding LacI/PurR family transcriptional regulator